MVKPCDCGSDVLVMLTDFPKQPEGKKIKMFEPVPGRTYRVLCCGCNMVGLKGESREEAIRLWDEMPHHRAQRRKPRRGNKTLG